MLRIFVTLLVLASLRPSLVAATVGGAQVPEWQSAVERLAPAAPPGARPAAGGWEILPRSIDVGPQRNDRIRFAGDSNGTAAAGVEPARSVPTRRGGAAALLDAGVLRVRYEHLPYFATAPPPSR